MPVLAGTVQTNGLAKMVQGVSTTASMSLFAYDNTAQEEYAGVVTYEATTTGVAEISSTVSITIPEDGHIDKVTLGTGTLISQTFAVVLTDIDFPNGGDLIITSYKLTVAV